MRPGEACCRDADSTEAPGGDAAPRALTTTLLLAIGLGVVVVAGAGATTPRAKSPTVSIKNFAFSPKTLTVKAGAKVRVKNKDGTTHTFTADKGAFDTGDIDGGSSAKVTVKKPGHLRVPLQHPHAR